MKVLRNNYLFYGLVSLIAIVLSLWLYYLAPHKGSFHTNYNDFLIFRQSFRHLLQHNDLYILYPNEYNDLFKYSPSFAMFMVPFAYLPEFLGLIAWNVLNLLVVFYAFRNFSFRNDKRMLLAMGFILIEALTSLVATQSNCIMAGLLIITYICLEKKKLLWATFFVVLSIFIKPFGLVAFTLFLFYPEKLKALGYSVMWFILIFILPLLVISPYGLAGEYKSWFLLLKNDHDSSLGISFFGLMHSWFGLTNKNAELYAGAVFLVLPLIRYKAYANHLFQMLFLASILIWVIIFNHKAEAPGYIIAICGVAIWYFIQAPNKLNTILLFMVLVFTVLEPTDVFPKPFRDKYFTPNFVCVIPCVLVWIKIMWELMTKNFSLQEGSSAENLAE